MYVGVTEKSALERFDGHIKKSANGSATPFHVALSMYGPTEFDVLALHEYPDWDAALEAEDALVAALELVEFGFNAIPGGRANPAHSKAVRMKMSASHTGKKQSSATRHKRSLALMGHEVTDATRVKISSTMKGRQFSAETRAKMSAAKLGKPGRKLYPHERNRLGELARMRASNG